MKLATRAIKTSERKFNQWQPLLEMEEPQNKVDTRASETSGRDKAYKQCYI